MPALNAGMITSSTYGLLGRYMRTLSISESLISETRHLAPLTLGIPLISDL